MPDGNLDAFMYFKKNKGRDTNNIEGEMTDSLFKSGANAPELDKSSDIAGSPFAVLSYKISATNDAVWPDVTNTRQGKNKNWLPKVRFDRVTIYKQVDGGSPSLFNALVSNSTYDNVVLIQRRAGGVSGQSGHIFLKITFGDAVLTKFELDSAGNPPPSETFELAYRRFTLEYWPQQATGSKAAGGKMVEYRLEDDGRGDE